MITADWQKVSRVATMQYRPLEADPATEAPEATDNFTDTDPCLSPDGPRTPAERLYRVAVRGALWVALAAALVHLLGVDSTGRMAKVLFFAGVGLVGLAFIAFVWIGVERKDETYEQ